MNPISVICVYPCFRIISNLKRVCSLNLFLKASLLVLCLVNSSCESDEKRNIMSKKTDKLLEKLHNQEKGNEKKNSRKRDSKP